MVEWIGSGGAAAHTYPAWLQPPGGAEVVIAQDYQFRTEQQAVTTLDNSMVVSDGGQLQACNLTVN